jgi:hypothetical protein
VVIESGGSTPRFAGNCRHQAIALIDTMMSAMAISGQLALASELPTIHPEES